MQDSIDSGRVVEETGPRASRNRLQTMTLLDAIAEHGFDAAFGGARRDEERARAKERVFSFRDDFGQWDPRRQRPGAVGPLQRPRPPRRARARVPALQLDRARRLGVHRRRGASRCPSIYFAHEREVFARDGMLYAVSDFVERMDGEEPFVESVRYRTVGDMTLHRRRALDARPRSRTSWRRSRRRA